MSIDLGRRVAKLNYGDPFTAYTGVTITSPDSEDKYTAGNDSGRTIEVEIPWASQKMADNLLAQFSGVRHQPFTATGAILDPAAELGDAVTVDGVTGIMYRRDQRFGSNYRADISSPGDEEINHEIPYYPPIQRAVTRFGSVARGAAAAAAKAQGDILQDRKELIAALNREDGAPEYLLAGFDSYVRWDLANNEGFASSQLFAQIGEKARAEIGAYAWEDKDGNTHTVADIMADVIKLQGRIDLSGNVSVSDGQLTVLGNLVAAKSFQIGTENFYISGKKYTPQQITSTTGAVLALGYA